MAYEVRWSPEAAATLDHNPFRGRVVPEFEDSAYRETFVFSYRVIDRVNPAAVVVMAIVHGKRLLGNIPHTE